MRHLGDMELACAAMAPNDLSQEARTHLETCRSCRDTLQGLLADLQGLGGMAAEMTPVPAAFTLSQREQNRSMARPWLNWSFGGGLVAAALVLAVFWTGTPTRGVLPSPMELAPPVLSGFDSLEIMGGAEEEPFSPFEKYLLGGDSPALDNGWWNFVAPFEEEESRT